VRYIVGSLSNVTKALLGGVPGEVAAAASAAVDAGANINADS